MKVIIAGSRDKFPSLKDIDELVKKLSSPPTLIISGLAAGVDKVGLMWALSRRIPHKEFKPDWSRDKMGGPLRNEEMAKAADALILIWDGKSRGSFDMKSRAEAHDLLIIESII